MGEQWYHLIMLPDDHIVKCVAGGSQQEAWDLASVHLKKLRASEFSARCSRLIGVYRPYTAWEEKNMPKSFGYTETLLGSVDTDRAEWTPADSHYATAVNLRNAIRRKNRRNKSEV